MESAQNNKDKNFLNNSDLTNIYIIFESRTSSYGSAAYWSLSSKSWNCVVFHGGWSRCHLAIVSFGKRIFRWGWFQIETFSSMSLRYASRFLWVSIIVPFVWWNYSVSMLRYRFFWFLWGHTISIKKRWFLFIFPSARRSCFESFYPLSISFKWWCSFGLHSVSNPRYPHLYRSILL